VREWKHQLPTAQVHEYVALQDRYEALKHWLLPARMQRNRCAQFNRYIQETHALFSAISDVSGKDVIVDSSKLRGRVLALAKVPDVELYVVHLVRDVRGVAWSLKKSFTKQEEQGIPRQIKALPVWRAAAQWCLVNLQSEWVKRQLPQERSLCIRYEDFVTDPKATLQRIGEFAGCNLWELGDAVMAGATMNVHHTIAGNRLRMAGRVKLRADEEWRCKLSRQEQWSISGVAGWMMRRYGYR
jgi:hypothetical protein